MKNYTCVFTMLGSLAISTAVLSSSVGLHKTQQPVSQNEQAVRYIEHEPQTVRYVDTEPGNVVYTENLPEQTLQVPRQQRIVRRLYHEIMRTAT